jgi:hexosaminidase
MMKLLLVSLLLGLPLVRGRAQTPPLNLMPLPAKISPGQGRLAVDSAFRIALTGVDDPRLKPAAARLTQRLTLQTGIPLLLNLTPDATQATFVIHCEHAGEPVQKLGEDESYRLAVSGKQARLDAPNPLGVLRGIETFMQLVSADRQGFAAPAVAIDDAPRFPWRGLLLDVSRHWMPVEVVKRNLNAMAAVKLNVFHWHLSDDQGFRVECKSFPKLQEFGSDGQFYTQDQVRDVIAYARERGIRVIPEFDVPGHSTSWLVGYPELASAPGPYQIERKWGVFDPTMDPTRESTYEFLDRFIGEMSGLFPDEYFHIGGDEVTGRQWKANPRIQAFMREHGFKDNGELQAYFNKRMLDILKKHGKRMEGWDEILNPDLPKDIVIQAWRDRKALAQAADSGYQGILSVDYYVDLALPASLHYLVEPLDKELANLTETQKARVLGGEAAMWAEFVDAENVDSRLWPRTAAIAERFWSPRDVNDVASMYRRLEAVSRNLDWTGATHRSSYYAMLERLAGADPIEPLKTLADVVEPIKRYQRHRNHSYTQQTPLNRLVDAARPESDVAREFASLVDARDRQRVRVLLTQWRDNDASLRPELEKSFLLAELVPLSQDLSRLGTVGLQAVEALDSRKPKSVAWLSQQQALIDGARKPRAEVTLAIVPGIQKLLDQVRALK